MIVLLVAQRTYVSARACVLVRVRVYTVETLSALWQGLGNP